MRIRRDKVARRGQVISLGLAFALGAGLLPATPASADSTAKVVWGNCPADVIAKHPVPVPQCAKVPVPLDYAKPNGPEIDIMISRLASTSPLRRGILITNPGGPGGEGLSMPAELVSLGLPTTVSDRYDVIGMDPRGVGHSSPVSCGFTTDQKYSNTGNVPPYAVNAGAVTAQAGIAKDVADQCAEHDRGKGLLRYLSTANTARDLDTIRAALGEDKLNYFGGSYGTVLGAAYASLFPQRSDRIILDSNSGGTALDRASQRRFGLGFASRFPDLAKFVAARSAAYGLGRTPAEARRNFTALLSRLDKTPGQGMDGPTFRSYIFGLLYNDTQLPQAAQFWQAVATSTAPAVQKQVRAAGEVSPNDNMFSAYLAVVCNDSAWPRDLATYQRDVVVDRQKYPLFGAAGANIMPCAFWHSSPAEPQVAINDKGPRNILLLQNLRDPATPYAGALMLHKSFSERSRLVTVDQGGHGAYVYSNNACVLNVATAYLVDGVLPRKDLFCKAS